MPVSGASTTASGLTAAEVEQRRRRDGPNRLPQPRGTPRWVVLARQMTHFFAVLLWVAAVLAWVAGFPALAVAIGVVVVVNGLFAFWQQDRADRAAARLRDLLPVRAVVVRDGRRTTIDATDLVIDDLVVLEGGDRVCADLLVVEAVRLAVDESLMTGESEPVHPVAGDSLWAGSYVVEGEAAARVAQIGAHTALAGVAALTAGVQPRPGPLTRQLSRVVRVIAVLAVTVGAVFFGIAVLLGMRPGEGFLFAVGVTVALVPEGLLPTVTLSLARAAQQMAHQHALVRKLEAVETLGSTTFICSDKTGTLTRNQMTVVEVWTPVGVALVEGEGYTPQGRVVASGGLLDSVRSLATSALLCSTGRVHQTSAGWLPVGDPMEAALHALALRCDADVDADPVTGSGGVRFPFDPRRRRESALVDGVLHVKGAPDAVLPLCDSTGDADATVHEMALRGLRVLAVASRRMTVDVDVDVHSDPSDIEVELTLLGLVGIEDPPRPGAAESVQACRDAGIRMAMVTGDHPGTARSIAEQVGLLGADPLVISGDELPEGEVEVGELLDRDGVVVARVTPPDKLRIAAALQARGHVVAMTGDGVNDGPALRQADIGIAMGASGTDVAREAADLVLLDDHFATIVSAVSLGRATFFDIRRFLTYHLTDNVAELVPFVAWALTGGSLPLAIGVLQVLALDIGTDLLPALALGAEPPHGDLARRPPPRGQLIDRSVVVRAFGILGPTEALVSMTAFVVVLSVGGWSYGESPPSTLLALASGTTFAAIVLGQVANAFAMRSSSRPVWRLDPRGNPLLIGAVAVELVLLVLFLGVPALARLLGGSWPSTLGWALALLAVPAVVLVDALHKSLTHRSRSRG